MSDPSVDPPTPAVPASCEHTCPRDCTLLNRMLLRETALGGFYNQLLQECDYPDVRKFVVELAREHDDAVRKLEGRLNELYASFDPSGV